MINYLTLYSRYGCAPYHTPRACLIGILYLFYPTTNRLQHWWPISPWSLKGFTFARFTSHWCVSYSEELLRPIKGYMEPCHFTFFGISVTHTLWKSSFKTKRGIHSSHFSVDLGRSYGKTNGSRRTASDHGRNHLLSHSTKCLAHVPTFLCCCFMRESTSQAPDPCSHWWQMGLYCFFALLTFTIWLLLPSSLLWIFMRFMQYTCDVIWNIPTWIRKRRMLI